MWREPADAGQNQRPEARAFGLGNDGRGCSVWSEDQPPPREAEGHLNSIQFCPLCAQSIRNLHSPLSARVSSTVSIQLAFSTPSCSGGRVPQRQRLPLRRTHSSDCAVPLLPPRGSSSTARRNRAVAKSQIRRPRQKRTDHSPNPQAGHHDCVRCSMTVAQHSCALSHGSNIANHHPIAVPSPATGLETSPVRHRGTVHLGRWEIRPALQQ